MKYLFALILILGLARPAFSISNLSNTTTSLKITDIARLYKKPKLVSVNDTLTVGQAYTTDQRTFASKNFDPNNNDLLYQVQFVKQRQLINLFTPFYDKNICEPGDLTNPIYINFAQKANALIEEVKSRLIKRSLVEPGTRARFKRRVGETGELKNFKLVLLPVYYLTFNIASYEKGQNLKRYFNLDTMTITYGLMRGEKLIALVKYEHTNTNLLELNERDSINHNQVKLLKHDPIGIIASMNLPKYRKGAQITNFGYVYNNQLFYARTFHGNQIKHLNNGTEQKELIRKSDLNKLDDNFLNQDQLLLQLIKREYKDLIVNEHLQQLVPSH